MALVLTVLIYGAIFYGAYRIRGWARRSWYPPRMLTVMGVSVLCGTGITAAIGLL